MDTPSPVAGSSPTPENTPAVAPTPTPVAPAAPAAAPAPAAPTPSARDVLGELSAPERAQLMGGKKFSEIIAARPASKNAAPATPEAAPAPAPAAPAPAAAAPAPAPVAPAEPAAPTPAPDENDDTPDRFRFKDAEDKAIALLAKTKKISIREATKLYEGPSAAPAAPAAPVEPAIDAELAEYDTQITKLDERVKKLTADRLKAREDMDTEKGDTLSDEIAEARTNAVLLKNERQGFVRNREQSAVQKAEQQIISSRDRAVAQYPDLQVEGSMPQLALAAYVQRAIDDPSRAAEFKDPSWPEKITHEFAQKQGLKKAGSVVPTPAPAAPAAAPATPQALLRPQPKQVPGARSMTSADGSQPSAPAPLTADELIAKMARMTPEERRQVRMGVTAR